MCSNFSLSWQSLDSSIRQSLVDCGLGILVLSFVLSILPARNFFVSRPASPTPKFRVASDTSFVAGRGLYLMGKSIARR